MTRIKIAAQTVVALISLGLEVLPASAQRVLQEQDISSPNTLVQGYPSLAAKGPVAFANWRSLVEHFRDGAAISRSSNRGESWYFQSGFPLLETTPSVSPPTSGLVLDDNHVLFAFSPSRVETYRGIGAEPVAWEPSTAAIPYTPTSNSAGHRGTTLGSHSDGLRCYIAATELFDGLASEAYIRFARSLDGGTNWLPPERLAGPACMGPSLAVDAGGGVNLGWIDYATGTVALRKSTTEGITFGDPSTVAAINDNLGTRPFGWRRNDGNEPSVDYPTYRKPNLAPNFPALAVDRSTGPTHGNLYMVWAEYADGSISPATASFVVGSTNTSFATALVVPLNSDVSGSMPDVHVSNTSRYIAFDGIAGQTAWIDGTASPNQHSYNLFWEMADGSKVFSHAGYLTSANPAFGRTAPTILTLPRTGRYYVNVFPPTGSSVSFTFRIRTYVPSAASASRDMRDIVLVRSTDGGQTWSSKVRVNHDPAGSDQHQPNVAVDELGRVYVAWYDRRDVAAGDGVNAYASVSSDGGLTFGQDLRLSSQSSTWRGPPDAEFNMLPGEMIGDRIGIAAGDNFGIVAWTDLRNWPARSNIYVASIVDAPTSTDAVSDLNGEATSNGPRLRWLVNDFRKVSALRIYRSGEDEPEVALGAGEEVPTRSGAFEYLDRSAEPGATYDYRLAVRVGTATTWLGPVSVTVPRRVSALACRAVGPNPFVRQTAVTLAVPRSANGVVRVFDIQGKAVKTLAEGTFEPGERTLAWDGRDQSGVSAAPGLYFVSAEVGGERAQVRLARIP